MSTNKHYWSVRSNFNAYSIIRIWYVLPSSFLRKKKVVTKCRLCSFLPGKRNRVAMLSDVEVLCGTFRSSASQQGGCTCRVGVSLQQAVGLRIRYTYAEKKKRGYQLLQSMLPKGRVSREVTEVKSGVNLKGLPLRMCQQGFFKFLFRRHLLNDTKLLSKI